MATDAPRARSQTAELTVLFDRDCGFCNWTVRQLQSLDRHRRLDYVALQSAPSVAQRPDLASVAAGHPLSESIHVVRQDGTVEARGHALLAILDVLPGAWLLRPWTRLPGISRAADALYDPLAAHRHVLGRLVARGDPARCAVAPESVRSRAGEASRGD